METTQIQQTIYTIFDGFTADIKLKYKNPDAYLIRIFLKDCMLTEFSIASDDMFINALHKCEGVSGSIMLDKIELFARTIGIKTITLNDASNIIIEECKIKISLQVLYLLTAGMSWYNSKGYVEISPLYTTEDTTAIRSDVINQPMSTFIPKVITGLSENEYYEYYRANGKTFDDTVNSQGTPTNYMYELLTKINIIVGDLHLGLLVKDYFTIVKALLKIPPTNCILFKHFEELIMFIDESFLLHKDLHGSTKKIAGVKRRKSCKKCLKNKKHRNRHSKKHTKNKRKKGNQILTFNLNDIK